MRTEGEESIGGSCSAINKERDGVAKRETDGIIREGEREAQQQPPKESRNEE
jgi:hypothetical protein